MAEPGCARLLSRIAGPRLGASRTSIRSSKFTIPKVSSTKSRHAKDRKNTRNPKWANPQANVGEPERARLWTNKNSPKFEMPMTENELMASTPASPETDEIRSKRTKPRTGRELSICANCKTDIRKPKRQELRRKGEGPKCKRSKANRKELKQEAPQIGAAKPSQACCLKNTVDPTAEGSKTKVVESMWVRDLNSKVGSTCPKPTMDNAKPMYPKLCDDKVDPTALASEVKTNEPNRAMLREDEKEPKCTASKIDVHSSNFTRPKAETNESRQA